jgi:exodeoxyribonuclease-3
MKLISWNVNGIRSVLKQGFLEFIETFQPDVLCLQETKAPAKELEFVLPGYHLSWNHAGKAGYSGVATFCKTEPLSVSKGMGIKEHDSEGRILTTEHPEFFVVNTYVPNSKRTLERLYRHVPGV